MATREKTNLAALNKENCQEHPRSNLAQNSNVPRSQEDYITQVSEEIEGRVTKKLSHEFSRTQNRIPGALARLDDFLMNPLLEGHSGTTPETSRKMFSINRERMRITPRVTLILKRASSSLAGRIATTWRREFRESVHRRMTTINNWYSQNAFLSLQWNILGDVFFDKNPKKKIIFLGHFVKKTSVVWLVFPQTFAYPEGHFQPKHCESFEFFWNLSENCLSKLQFT